MGVFPEDRNQLTLFLLLAVNILGVLLMGIILAQLYMSSIVRQMPLSMFIYSWDVICNIPTLVFLKVEY